MLPVAVDDVQSSCYDLKVPRVKVWLACVRDLVAICFLMATGSGETLAEL